MIVFYIMNIYEDIIRVRVKNIIVILTGLLLLKRLFYEKY